MYCVIEMCMSSAVRFSFVVAMEICLSNASRKLASSITSSRRLV